MLRLRAGLAKSQMPETTIRIVIIEDRREIREGLKTLIAYTAGYECVAAYRSMEEALPEIESARAEVALVDLGLPGMSGIEGIQRLRQIIPHMQSLVLSVYDDDERVFQAICAGACGYLLKNTPPAELLAAIREAASGGAPISPKIASKVLTLFRAILPQESSPAALTPHELRLLRLLVEGHNYKTAAAEMGVSVHGISFHTRNIYEKLQVHSKSEAVAKALRLGLVR
jgi:DNA-binding NarL/FixJ family response regulator